jgi:hypothetical protein
MTAYFERLDHSTFRATAAVQGAWNTDEQHIAPALGLIAHALEQEHGINDAGTSLDLARISYDILGVVPIEIVEISTRVLRPGRTVRLVEATLSHGQRPAVMARAWLMHPADTRALAGTTLLRMPRRDELERWDPSELWPGEFVSTVDIRRHEAEPGHATMWMRPLVPLLEHEPIRPTTRLLALVDLANGVSPRVPPTEYAFPNVDLTAHLIRPPSGEWIGFDTTVSFGPTGTGMTCTLLYDDHGLVGTTQQALTIRPRGR